MKVYQKTLIAIKNSGQMGKSSSAREFATLLLATFSNHQLLDSNFSQSNLKYDISLIVKIKNKIVAIESQGDPNTNLKERLQKIVLKFNPDIIVTTCRTSGETLNAIKSNMKTYQVIFTSSYSCEDEPMQIALNELKGKHILDLLQNFDRI